MIGVILNFTVSGKVVSNGKGINDAVIYVKELGIRAYTDDKGNFKMNLPKGKYTLIVQSLGYRVERIGITINSDTAITLSLRPLEYTLGEIEVSPKTKSVFESAEPKFLEAIPFVGDQDVGYFISIAPGVVPVYGLSYFSVRGSSPFENLITFDNIPIYNAFSYYGMYTPINVDIVGGVEFLRGGFTPEIGNLSGSLISFKSKSSDSLRYVFRFSRTNTGFSALAKGWLFSLRMGLFAPLKYWRKVGIRLGDLSGKFDFGNSLKGFSLSYIANISDNIYLNDYRGLYYKAGILNGGFSINGRYYMGKVFLRPRLVYSISTFNSWDSSRKDPFNPRIQPKSINSNFSVLTLRNDAEFSSFSFGNEISLYNANIDKDSISKGEKKPFIGNYIKYRFENINILTEFGIRLDYMYDVGLKPSPSGFFKYYFNSTNALKVQGGIYRQFITSLYAFPPQFFFYTPVKQNEILSYQVIFGGERVFPWGISEINIFEKYYPKFVYLDEDLNERVGIMNSFGFDLWVRKESKVPVPLTADLSYTFMISRIKLTDTSEFLPTPWDVNHTINGTASFHLIRDKYEVILGVSIAYLVGRPYRGYLSHYRTPFYGEVYIQDTTNRLKLPPYARIDVFSRAPIPLEFGGFKFDISFSVINLFPNKNITFDPTNPDADFANLTTSYPISSIVLRAVF
ncbi:MAG: TonB-dependent receptor [candidate division WOR-3 bacterium]